MQKSAFLFLHLFIISEFNTKVGEKMIMFPLEGEGEFFFILLLHLSLKEMDKFILLERVEFFYQQNQKCFYDV